LTYSNGSQININGNSNSAIDEEDEEDRDKFLEISLSDPTKMGDGMGSYMVYKLTTKVNSNNS
jgi:sorting nexin-1/2